LGFGLLLGVVVRIAIVLGSTSGRLVAGLTGPDSDNPTFDANYATKFYYADPNLIVQGWTTLVLFANTNLMSTHVRADCGCCLPHWHQQTYFPDINDPNRPWLGVDDFDRYWDSRFNQCTRLSGATNKQNCHAWAFDNYSDPGYCTPVYKFWIDTYDENTIPHAYASDRGWFRNPDIDKVEPNDFLSYDEGSSWSHTTVVVAVRDNGSGGNEPRRLKWKFNASGVYHYYPPDGYEYCTPMNKGATKEGQSLCDQGWVWDPSFQSYVPFVWPDDND
jgi:hypothetical protein